MNSVRYESSRKPIVFALILASFFIAACSKKAPFRIPGERISVLTFEGRLEVDPEIGPARVLLPSPYVNQNWPQSGGATNHAMHHLFAPENLTEAWRVSIGVGDKAYERLVSAPVVANGVIYTIDVKSEVRAFNADNGALIWAHKLTLEDEFSKVGFGGGLAVHSNKVFATTGYGFLVALDTANGNEIWRAEAGIPLRSGPTVADGRVYAMTQDNRLMVVSASTGELLWDYVGIVENAGVLGSASPAVEDGTVITAFSSGEIFAMRAENGQVLWQDALSRTGRLSAVTTLNDIDGNPVIDRTRVYAINHGGRMVSIDLRNGERVWEANIGGIYQPWIAGSYIFVVTSEGQLAALTTRDGRVKWVTELQRFEDPVDRSGLIRWAGPILVGDRLVVVSSHGYLLSVSPYTGEVMSGEKIEGGSVIAPIVANQTVYILTTKGELIAYR